MTQAYRAQEKETVGEKTSLAFKRHILEKTAGFSSEPVADAFRVNLLSKMLDRYDELRAKGIGEQDAMHRTMYEYDDIAVQMRDMGFEEIAQDDEPMISRWPQLTVQDAESYIRERDAYMHKTALGVLMCVACLAPMLFFLALGEFLYMAEEFLVMFGIVGMFVMIGMGVYAMVTAAKPKSEKRIKKGRFSLLRSTRRKMEQMKEAITEKARKRKGRGIAAIVTSVIPILIGAALTELWWSDGWVLLGVCGMFLMIGVGVYELVMADGEKKTIGRILKSEEE